MLDELEKEKQVARERHRAKKEELEKQLEDARPPKRALARVARSLHRSASDCLSVLRRRQ